MSKTTQAQFTVHVGEHFAGVIDQLLGSGRYGNRSEIIRAGLRAVEMENRARLRLLAGLQGCDDEDEAFETEEIAALNEEIQAAG